jgi:NAD(P)-dependent dehydrogenase (short-subunit alcohol dehydrogenase family)
MTDWRDRVVVITGASAGVGRALTRELARRGASLGLLARGVEGLDAARDEAESAGARALALPTDVADAAAVEAAAARIERELGPIDVWVNNAMVSVFSPIDRMTPHEFERVTRVTYLGAVHGTLAALTRMKPRDRGTIVQVGSALAYRGIPLQSAYCAAKHALQGFTESLRAELLHDGSHIHVTMVHFPALNTPQFEWSRSHMPRQPQPVPPIFQPELAANAIVWAIDHRRREVLVGWPTVKAVLGNSLMPWYVDKYLARFGYDAQQTDEPVARDRPDNLFTPVSHDYGAHGRFDAQARSSSAEWWISRHRVASFVGVLAVGATAALAALRHRARAHAANV